MIDLSNNNGPVDFHRLYHQAGQRRVYLKVTEGTGFVDRTYPGLRQHAHEAGLKVGGYHFAHPLTNTPHEEAQFFSRHLSEHGLRPTGHDLRPCLDLERGSPSPRVGTWAVQWLELVERELGVHPIVYGSPSFLAGCHFQKVPAPLWLASYGRDDGREHPFTIPAPWHASQVVAHQFSSRSRVAGCSGLVDLSKVEHGGRGLDL